MKNVFYFTLLTLLLINVSCSEKKSSITEPEDQYSLVLESVIELDIEEPSGLTYDPNTGTLWTVNDPDNNKVYNISLTGELLQTLSYVGDDLEGIAYDNSTNSLWLAEEETSEIVNISLQGEELQRIELIISDYYGGTGLEGLCIGDSGEFYLLKERNPGLFIELSQDFSTLTEIDLSFADDYSGICYDSAREGFWIVSDESEKLYLWDSINGVREQFSLNFSKAEGIVFLPESQTFYIVSDSEEKLYKFSLQSNY